MYTIGNYPNNNANYLLGLQDSNGPKHCEKCQFGENMNCT